MIGEPLALAGEKDNVSCPSPGVTIKLVGAVGADTKGVPETVTESALFPFTLMARILI